MIQNRVPIPTLKLNLLDQELKVHKKRKVIQFFQIFNQNQILFLKFLEGAYLIGPSLEVFKLAMLNK